MLKSTLNSFLGRRNGTLDSKVTLQNVEAIDQNRFSFYIFCFWQGGKGNCYFSSRFMMVCSVWDLMRRRCVRQKSNRLPSRSLAVRSVGSFGEGRALHKVTFFGQVWLVALRPGEETHSKGFFSPCPKTLCVCVWRRHRQNVCFGNQPWLALSCH